MAIKPETKIVNKIQAWVKDNGGKALKYHGDAMGELGSPDLLVALPVRCMNGFINLHIMVEVKIPGKEPDPIQEYRMQEWAALGFIVCSPTSLAELTGVIDAEINKRWNTC